MTTETFDVLVVGAGAAGLMAAYRSSARGLSTLLIEQQDKIGGTTMLSGGTLWIPGNPLAESYRIQDDLTLGNRYLAATIGNPTTASSRQRRDAFLTYGPVMIRSLIQSGFQFDFATPLCPDYHPNQDGGLPDGGRTIEPAIFDASRLRGRVHELALPDSPGPLVSFKDLRILARPRASVLSFAASHWILFKSWFRRLRGLPVTMGSSLVAQLFWLCTKQSTLTICRNAKLDHLTIEGGRVVGAMITWNGTPLKIRATGGVVLAAAGFARNESMRRSLLRAPFTKDATLTAPGGDTGDAVSAGIAAGGALALMDESWGIPVIRDPGTGRVTQATLEMAKPHCIVVDGQGSRFFSEAQPCGDASRSLFESPNAPAWLVLDAKHRRRYVLGSLGPGADPSSAVRKGLLVQAETLTDMAEELGLSAVRFVEAVHRWNSMCEEGVDRDFQKGKDAYQRFLGDPNVQPNPNMGSISEAPFYAVGIWPGDVGTKGGLLTDEYARVVRSHGAAIRGLYAVGNTAASLMGGHSSIAAGATLGPAMTFAYIAAEHLHGVVNRRKGSPGGREQRADRNKTTQ